MSLANHLNISLSCKNHWLDVLQTPHDSWISTVRFANQNSKQMCFALEMQKIHTKSIFLINHAEETNIEAPQVQLFILPRQRNPHMTFGHDQGWKAFTQMPEVWVLFSVELQLDWTLLFYPISSPWIGRFSAIPQPRWWHLVLMCNEQPTAVCVGINWPQMARVDEFKLHSLLQLLELIEILSHGGPLLDVDRGSVTLGGIIVLIKEPFSVNRTNLDLDDLWLLDFNRQTNVIESHENLRKNPASSWA